MAHFFPDYRSWMRAVTDTRQQDLITYPRQFLLWMGLMIFLLKLQSRRRVRFELDSPAALVNINRLSGTEQETMAHSDTIEHFLGHVPLAALETLRHQGVQRLIRMKVLDGGRLQTHLLVGVDGTGQLSFGTRRHCAHCLTKKVEGTVYYYHHVLEAKLVTPDGLAISLGSESIENSDSKAKDPKTRKQDCELKAFGRLAKRLRRQYPQLRLCLLLDALYANGTAMQICQQNHWKYITTFKPGSLPSQWQEYQSLQALCPWAIKKVSESDTRPGQVFRWVNDLRHLDDQKREHRFAAFQCQERDQDGTEHLFAWLTNFRVDAATVANLANRGGRCRWKIENEGFNIQKNGGFNLEHAYSTKHIKHWYILLQIAHTILQLMERGSLLSAPCKKLFGSLWNLARRLAESLRHFLIPLEALDLRAAAAIQIRLNPLDSS